ncbi:40S small subunit processome assembly factor 1 [Gastrophryne carolinensis]
MATDGQDEQLRHQLDCVLSQFYDFGDDFQTPQVIVSETEQQNEDVQPEEDNKSINRPKINKAADCSLPAVHSKKGKKNASLFFQSIKDELYSQPKSTEAPIISGPQQVQVVTFVSHKPQKETKDKDAQDKDLKISIDSKEDGKGEAFDFEKARLEVHKFGITGYKKEKQRKFEQERAIMLGAKPPKREYVNYKAFQEKKKELKRAKKEEELAESSLELTKKKRKPGQKDRRPKKSKGLSGNAPDGQVGRFRDGALILSSRDIQKIKLSKVIK